MKVTGAILAGGQSSRLGTDKALLRLDPDGPTLLEIAVRRLQEIVPDVAIIAPPRGGYDVPGATLVEDRYPGIGPLGGIATALVATAGEAVIVVSCDMPFIESDVLRFLRDADAACAVVVPQTSGESRQGGRLILQTLCARYGRDAFPAIERALARGERRVISFYADVAVCPIDDAAFRRLDHSGRSLFSVNTPEALATAMAWIGNGD